MGDTVALAVDISTAPKHIQEEIESLRGKIHSMDDLEKVSRETKDWLLSNYDPDIIWRKMENQMKKAISEMETYTKGITMLKTITSEDKAKQINLDLYNACAKYVREYNNENLS